MANIIQTPRQYTDAIFTLDGDTFTGINSATLDPEQSVSFFRDISGNVTPSVGPAAWTLNISGCQDNQTANSLVKKLRSLSVAVTGSLKESATATSTATFTVLPKKVQYGGAEGEYLSVTIDLPVVGQPNIT